MRALGGALSAELRKLLTLPGVWIAIALTTAGSAAITALNARTVRGAVLAGDTSRLADTSAFEAGFAAVPIIGVVGSVVIGALAIGSEYTADRAESGGARQITTTLTATPNRVLLFFLKILVVVPLIALVAAVTIPGNYALASFMIGDAGTETMTLDDGITRALGATLYWVLMAVIAFAITALVRSVMIPLAVLIVNSSLVPFSLLLRNVTPLADWLPDSAGRNLFGFPPDSTIEGGLEAGLGAIVMGCWAAALVVIAAVMFVRRDA